MFSFKTRRGDQRNIRATGHLGYEALEDRKLLSATTLSSDGWDESTLDTSLVRVAQSNFLAGPDIAVSFQNADIADGDTTASAIDGTDFGAVIAGSKVISDGGDPDDQRTEATALNELLQSIEGEISNGTDVDLYRVDASPGERISALVTSDSLNFSLRLFDSEGQEIVTAVGSGQTGARVSHFAETSGAFYFGVSSAGNHSYEILNGGGDTDGGSVGAYQIELEDSDDQISEAIPIKLGTGTSKFFRGGLDVEMYSFNVAEPGMRIGIDTSVYFGSDTVLRLFDENGTELAMNDDQGDLGSSLTYEFDSVGTYYFGVSVFGNDEYDPVTGDGDISTTSSSKRYSVSLEPVSRFEFVNLGTVQTIRNFHLRNDAYIMYSQRDVRNRFDVPSDYSSQFVAVTYSAANHQWRYTNGTITVEFEFEPNDFLVARVTGGIDVLDGEIGVKRGVSAGIYAGDLSFTRTGDDYIVEGTFFDRQKTPNQNRIFTTVGNLRKGVLAPDLATGTGYLLHSKTKVHQRFIVSNSNHATYFVAVRLLANQWQYASDTEGSWSNFAPDSNDVLVAEVDFDADTVTSLSNRRSVINGISAGYVDGDLEFLADSFGGLPNDGEFEILGTQFVEKYDSEILTGAVNKGIAVDDAATGAGYIMYSATTVENRFGGAHFENAEHFIAVRYQSSQWQYGTNNRWFNFQPDTTDVLLAEVDFGADTIQQLKGFNKPIQGIAAGYQNSNLIFTPNIWNGSSNAGEFGVVGEYFDRAFTESHVGVFPLGKGIAVEDGATGIGYLMYSDQDVHQRFSGVHVHSADHLIAVRLTNSQWEYGTNDFWFKFTPDASDRLLAHVDFGADTITKLEGNFASLYGIQVGYFESDLQFTANSWNGVENAGEFGVSGTYFKNQPTVAKDFYLGAVNSGVVANDFYNGSGYLMFSEQNIQFRFERAHPNNADHFVAVRVFEGRWQYTDNDNWFEFQPAIGDTLVAEVNFGSANTVTSLLGTNSVINGMSAGFANGDLEFAANTWNGSANAGEFGVTGTYFHRNVDGEAHLIGSPGNGVAAIDSAIGTGYMLYSATPTHQRFGGIHPFNSESFVAVRLFSGTQWQYSTNDFWFDFTPEATDILMAEIDFTNDIVTNLVGNGSTINGITAGFQGGDLIFTANSWAGQSNAGEFGVAGTMFNSLYSFSGLNSGILVVGNPVGTGYLMYSSQSVQQRFGQLFPERPDHFIAVKQVLTQWQYNDGTQWVAFTPNEDDVLLFELDFARDNAFSLLGIDSVVGGIAAGFTRGNLEVTGSYALSGSFFVHDGCV